MCGGQDLEADDWEFCPGALRGPRGLILVHETAPNHGGITIAQLRDECPREVEPLVFSARHLENLVPFYRHERIWQVIVPLPSSASTPPFRCL